MSYLHCHNCNWSQDDFWHETYNPVTFLEKNYKKDILTGDLDRVLEMDNFRWDKYLWHKKMLNRDFIADEMESMARKLRRMVYRTKQEYLELNPEQKCPNCGKKELDID